MAMTGFNPTEAQQQLQEFMEYGKKVYEKAANALNDLETNLYNNWCSPKAVDFGHDRISRLACIEKDIDTLYNNMYKDGVDAYNSLASSNGAPTMACEVEEEFYYLSDNFRVDRLPDFREANEDGVVGMDVEKVKLARDTYLAELESVETYMEDTPMDIAFFDPDNELQTKFKAKINKIVTYIKDTIAHCFRDIDESIDSETNVVMTGQQSAAENLSA